MNLITYQSMRIASYSEAPNLFGYSGFLGSIKLEILRMRYDICSNGITRFVLVRA